MDVFTKKQRSVLMSRIRGRDTKPEVAVRRILRKARHQIRRYDRSLPGTPDFVLPKIGVILLVNGCFWHGHGNCRQWKFPSSNQAFWRRKIERNRLRDRRQIRALRSLGWSVASLWTCRDLTPSTVLGRIE